MGFISAVAFATILAVVSGLTLAGASAISHDIYANVINPNATDEQVVKISKITVIIVGIVGVTLGIAFESQNIAVIAVVGLIDDIIELSPKLRMIVFALVGATGLYIIGGLDTITFGLFDISNPIITSIIAMLLILWYINLTNFIDGIDSYLAMKFIFLSVAGLILFGADHFAVLGVSVLGFLYWNWHKAKIFMGDVGSTLLGYTIAIITIYYANIEATNLWIWVTLYGVFWFDATVTLVRRLLNGEKPSVPHKKHAYQRLTQAGWSHSKVTLHALGLNVVIFLLVYFIPNVAVSFALSLAQFIVTGKQIGRAHV